MRILPGSKYDFKDEVFIKDVDDIWAGWRSMFKRLGFKNQTINNTDQREKKYYYTTKWEIFGKVYENNNWMYAIRSLDDNQFELLTNEDNLIKVSLTPLEAIVEELNSELNN